MQAYLYACSLILAFKCRECSLFFEFIRKIVGCTFIESTNILWYCYFTYTVWLFLNTDVLSITFGERDSRADSHPRVSGLTHLVDSLFVSVCAFSVYFTCSHPHIDIYTHITHPPIMRAYKLIYVCMNVCEFTAFYDLVWSDMIVWHYYCYSTFIESLSHCEWNIYRSFCAIVWKTWMSSLEIKNEREIQK